MENSRQNTRFRWRDAKRMEKVIELVNVEGTKTEIGGDLEVDGDLIVNGSAPGGLFVHKCGGTSGITFICGTGEEVMEYKPEVLDPYQPAHWGAKAGKENVPVIGYSDLEGKFGVWTASQMTGGFGLPSTYQIEKF